jgi:hypothetical protein
MASKTQVTKEIEKLDLIKIKSICVSRDTIIKVKRKPVLLEKTFINISNKILALISYNEHLQINNKREIAQNKGFE